MSWQNFYPEIAIINEVMLTLFVICVIAFVISGIDELLFDVVYWWHYFTEGRKTEDNVSVATLSAHPEQRIAVLVPCWQEHLVIGEMLRHNLAILDYSHYDFFIGVYANDPAMLTTLKIVQVQYPHVHVALYHKNGPTKKADNLNNIYATILEYEKKHQLTFDIFLLHDAEDVIHPLSLKLYNYWIPTYDMLQTPVFPLEVRLHHWTHWIYNDEFAELHTKNIVVRGLLHGFIPSAGVGTGFSRQALVILAEHNNDSPFAVNSFTEDYDSALRLQTLGLSALFYSRKIEHSRKRKKWLYWGPFVSQKAYEYIATRSLFPMTYSAAVRQRARWVFGIVLQEWMDAGWPGNFATRYMLLHDRKAIITHAVNGLAYIVLIYCLVDFLWQNFYPGAPILPQYLFHHHLIYILSIIATILMCNRFLQRFISTYRVYGFWAAISSFPRVVYGNILNMHTSFRALRNYIRVAIGKKPITWAKTANVFPAAAQMSLYKRKLGDLLLKKKMITRNQLDEALTEQAKTHDHLGEILVRHHYINPRQLTATLSEQFVMPVVSRAEYQILPRIKLPQISDRHYQWLLNHQMLPISLSAENIVTVALSDPSDSDMQMKATEYLAPYQVRFVLIGA